MNVHEKLLHVQQELKAPKGQTNTFGKYKYRSCEDILEAVKPIAGSVKATVTLSDAIEMLGDRFYIVATATFTDVESMDQINVKAQAREEKEKKGMDGSQVTGASSSYARKYALNGLFCIDDTKDSDATNTGDKQDKPNQPQQAELPKPESIKCADCHGAITGIKQGGNTYTPSDIAKNTQDTYGKILCWKCAQEASKCQR